MFKKATITLFFLAFFLILFLVFPKKITKEKIETKITQVTTQIENVKETVAPKPSKMLANGLPNKYLIKAAFVMQAPEGIWTEPWQDTCEEASLLTVDYFYKNISSITTNENRDAILKMIDFENQQGFSSDMNVSQMAVVVNKYLNYQTKIIDNPTVENIKDYLVKNIPVIVPSSGKILYQENKHFNSGGPYYHNLVILGYDDDKKQFIVHDVGTKAGAYFHYSYSLLIDSIHDFPPSDKKEDINSGQKRVLILLK